MNTVSIYLLVLNLVPVYPTNFQLMGKWCKMIHSPEAELVDHTYSCYDHSCKNIHHMTSLSSIFRPAIIQSSYSPHIQFNPIMQYVHCTSNTSYRLHCEMTQAGSKLVKNGHCRFSGLCTSFKFPTSNTRQMIRGIICYTLPVLEVNLKSVQKETEYSWKYFTNRIG